MGTAKFRKKQGAVQVKDVREHCESLIRTLGFLSSLQRQPQGKAVVWKVKGRTAGKFCATACEKRPPTMEVEGLELKQSTALAKG